ncbi:MAG: geranylgeranylglycerol-phosphate geranylgeranyltransferase [Candidatus Helarchaeota archaeon]|nr:geranylgeranylglycerol-phosphate geranylgeranyltransferase [Candidatus Helarchaeota archaeon]
MEAIKGSIELMRLLNGFMVGVAVLVGALASGLYLYHPVNTTIAILSAFFTATSGYILNDWKDVEIDKINCPERAIPSGKVSRNTALILAIAFMAAGDIIIWFANWECILIIMIGSVLITAYSLWLKKAGFIGNLTVAVLTGFCLLVGGASVEPLNPIAIEMAMWPAILAFSLNVGREIMKGIDDYEGDKAEGAKTLAVRWGRKKAAWVGVGFLSITIAISPFPYFMGYYNILYLILALVVDGILIVDNILILRTPTSEMGHQVKRTIKFAAFIGLLAFLIGIHGLILP